MTTYPDVSPNDSIAETQQQLTALFAQIPVAIAILRGPQFVVERANPEMCQIWNRSSAQLLGQPIFAVLPEAAGQGFEELLTGVLQTGIPFRGDELPVMLIRNGKPQPVFVSFTYKPFYDSTDGPTTAIMVVAADVTESRLLRQRDRESTNRLQTLVEQAPVGVAILGLGPAFIFELVNPFYCELAGRTADQMIGKPLLETMPELAGQGFDHLLAQVIETGIPYINRKAEIDLVRNGQLGKMYADFVYQPRYEPDGTITGVVAIATDITLAVQTQHRSEANERLLNAMIRQTPLGVAIFRKPDFVVELANPAVGQLWGRTLAQVLGKPFFTALPEATGQGFEELLTDVYETGIAFEGHELSAIIERDGHREAVYFDFVYEPLTEPDGRIERIMVVGTDATPARQARRVVEDSEATYRQLAADLEERVQCRTLELERTNLDLMQFASVASHDLKEPLRKIQTFGSMLQQTLAGRINDEESDLFSRLVNAAARMQKLVGDVLLLSILSDQTDDFEPVDLRVVITQIQDDLELVISERNAELTTSQLPVVVASPGQMHQIFQNLISNALKFNINPRPTVRVEAVPLTETLMADLALTSPDYVVIAVSDNGIGFDAKYADKIFGMFQRLHGRNQYAGTGIGLTIVKKIVENHRGFITVQSEPGRGTTFSVVLPA